MSHPRKQNKLQVRVIGEVSLKHGSFSLRRFVDLLYHAADGLTQIDHRQALCISFGWKIDFIEAGKCALACREFSCEWTLS